MIFLFHVSWSFIAVLIEMKNMACNSPFQIQYQNLGGEFLFLPFVFYHDLPQLINGAEHDDMKIPCVHITLQRIQIFLMKICPSVCPQDILWYSLSPETACQILLKKETKCVCLFLCCVQTESAATIFYVQLVTFGEMKSLSIYSEVCVTYPGFVSLCHTFCSARFSHNFCSIDCALWSMVDAQCPSHPIQLYFPFHLCENNIDGQPSFIQMLAHLFSLSELLENMIQTYSILELKLTLPWYDIINYN
jgi:hypothetical protein